MLLNIQVNCVNKLIELELIYFPIYSHQLSVLQSVSINMNSACGALKELA